MKRLWKRAGEIRVRRRQDIGLPDRQQDMDTMNRHTTLGMRAFRFLLAALLAFTMLPIVYDDAAFAATGAPDAKVGEEEAVDTGSQGQARVEAVLGHTAEGEPYQASAMLAYALPVIEEKVYGTLDYWKAVSNQSSLTYTTLNAGMVLSTGTYYINTSQTITNGAAGGHGISIADNATVYLRLVGSSRTTGPVLTVTGGAGSGTTAGGTGIHVPETAKLIIEGVGSVRAYGGKGGDPTSATAGTKGDAYYDSSVQVWAGKGGNGGSGGGSPGNGIGGAAGYGGTGGIGGAGDSTQPHRPGTYQGRRGAAGGSGGVGGTGASAGTVIFKGNVAVSGSAGAKSSNVSADGGGASYANHVIGAYKHTAGGGGGGGAAGDNASGTFIGTGAGAAGGGGGGGSGATWNDNYDPHVFGGAGGSGGAPYGTAGTGGNCVNTNSDPLQMGNAANATNGGNATGRPSYNIMSSGEGGRGGNAGKSGTLTRNVYATTMNSVDSTTQTFNASSSAIYRTFPIDECKIELYTAADGTGASTYERESDGTSTFYWTGNTIRPSVRITHIPTNTVLPSTCYTVTQNNGAVNAGVKNGVVKISGAGLSSTSGRATIVNADGMTSASEFSVFYNIKYDMDDLEIFWSGAKSTGNPVIYAWTDAPVGNGFLRHATTKRSLPYAASTGPYTKAYADNVNASELIASFTAVPLLDTAARKALWVGSTVGIDDEVKSLSANFSIRKAPTISTVGPYYDPVLGEVYSKQLFVEGYSISPDTITWMITGLPDGLTYHEETGLISGTPTEKGVYTAQATARNIAGSHTVAITFVVGDIQGSAWNDQNHNGQHDPGEYPIENVTVTAYRAGTSTALGTVKTNSFGHYAFAGLTPADQNIDLEFITPDASRFRVIGEEREEGIELGSDTRAFDKGFDRATIATLNAGAHGSFAGSPTKTLTGFQGDDLIIKNDEIGIQVEFGWRIEGWYYDQAATLPFNGIWPSEDLTLHAGYDERIYTVNYVTGSEAEQVEPLTTLLFTDAGLLPEKDPYRPGYKLDSWVLTSDHTRVVSSNDPYSDLVEDRYQLTATLEARWAERHDIAVTLDANGSTGAPATINGDATETHRDLKYNDFLNYSPPIREGYAFIGWSESKRYDPSVDPDPTMSLKVPGRNTVYYAAWEAEDVGIIFDATGGEFEPGDDGMRNGLPGEAYALPANPVRSGYAFAGWFETPAGANRVFAPNDGEGSFPIGKTYYFAQWEPARVTLQLESPQGAPEAQTISGIYGTPVSYTFPTRAGHSFLGWGVDGETVMFISYPAEDAAYSAVWAVGRNTVAYNPMGGAFAPGENGIRQGDTGDAYAIPSDPTRPGFTFAGWYMTPEYLEAAPADGIVPTESATYYAKWDAAVNTVHLYVGDSLFESPQGKYGEVIAYTVPSKSNATFVGWKTPGADDATASIYPTYPATDGQRYDAVFKDGAVSVVYHAAGGVFVQDDGIRIGLPSEDYAIPADPVLPGFEFSGWYDAPSGGILVHARDQREAVFTTAVNTVYYAQYRAGMITVILDAGPGSSLPMQQLKGESQTTVPYVEPVRDGYAFAGWKEPGTLDSTAVKNLVFPAEERTYHAVWTTSRIEVRFEVMGGSIVSADATPTGLPGSRYAIPAVEYAGHAFIGWFDRPVGGNLVFGPAETSGTFTQADQVVYARWVPLEISATLDAGNQAEPRIQAVNGFFGDTIAYRLPAKANSAFVGWKIAGSDDSTATMAPTFAAESGIVYAAVWAAGQASVSYDVQGGSFSEGEKGIRTGSTGDIYTPPSDPTRPGYSFGGWFTLPGGQGDPYTSTSFPSETNTLVYAYWIAQHVKATFNLNYAGSSDPATYTGTIGQIIEYDMPSRPGFAFLGWSKAFDAFTADVSYFPRFGEADATYYAQWQADAMTLRFHPVQGTFIGSETGFRTGQASQAYAVPLDPIRPGYSFVGWFTDIFEGAQIYPNGLYPIAPASTICYAHWAADAITVRLDENHALAPVPSEVTGTFGEKIDYTIPERTGYRFIGWSTDPLVGTGDLHPEFPQEGGATYYALWEARTVTVAYDAMAGTFFPGSAAEHQGTWGDAYEIPVVTRDGYEFIGWFTTPLGQTEAPKDGLIPADDAIYYAQWKENEVSVTFMLGGGMVNGSGEPVILHGRFGKNVEWQQPERTGFDFVGWKLPQTADNTATRFITFPDKETTYLAVWVPQHDVTIIYDAYGGTIDGDNVFSGLPGRSYTAPQVVTREGFRFAGWVLAPTDVAADHEPGDERAFPSGNALTVYYAKWIAETYSVTLEFEDGVTPSIEVSGAAGMAIDYADLLPTREGHVFKGWGDAPDAADYRLFPRYSQENDGTTYYAQWDAAGLMVTFFARGGDVGDVVYEGESGSSYAVPADSVRFGHTFDGWYSGKDGGGERIGKAAGEAVPFETGMTIAWYASWTRNPADVSLDANGGTFDGQQIVAMQGFVGDAIPYSAPVRDGHAFAGWSSDGGQTTAMTIFFSEESPVTYQAIWVPNDITLTYLAFGGAFLEGETGVRAGKAGDPFAAPVDPVRTGYAFGGWYIDSDCLVPAPAISVLPDVQTAFYAKWVPNRVTVMLSAVGSNLELQTLTGSYGEYIRYQAPRKDGAVFVGWRKEGSPTVEATITYPVIDAVYTAVFSTGVIIATFDPNGGLFVDDGNGVESGIRAGTAGEEVQAPGSSSVMSGGYDFMGWFTAPNGGSRVDSESGVLTMPVMSTTYYAHWEASSVTVTFDADNGSPTTEKTGKHGEAIGYDIPTKAGQTFIGWEGRLGEVAFGSATMFPEFNKAFDAAVYTAQWRSGAANVVFYAMGGAFDANFVGEIGDGYSIPEDPVREGYTFEGWYDSSSGGARQSFEAGDRVEMDREGVTAYYAHYLKNEGVNVVLDAGVGAQPGWQEARGTFGDAVDYTAPTRDGYTFRGWKQRTDPVQPDDSAQLELTFPAADTTYDAVWRANSVRYSFDANGGELPADNERQGVPEEDFDLPVPPTRIGYDFAGWYNLNAGGVLVYGPDEKQGTFGLDDATYYAHWDAIASSAAFDANGGIFADGSTSKAVNGAFGDAVEYEVPAQPTYAFIGWSTTADNESDDLMTVIIFEEDAKTYYAQWVHGQVSTLFRPQGGRFAYADEVAMRTGIANEPYNAPELAPREGYVFAGWYSEPEGKGARLPDDPVFGISGTDIYYAFWQPGNIMVTLKGNGGFVHPGNADEKTVIGKPGATIDYGSLPVREGYAFLGWSNDAAAEAAEASPVYGTSDEVLYAIWKAGAVTIDFQPAGGVRASASSALTVIGMAGDVYRVPTVERKGFTFTRWWTDPIDDASGPSIPGVPDASLTLPGSNATYYAQWEPIDHLITLDGNSGMFGSSVTLDVAGQQGALVATLTGYEQPTRSGYAFAGWSTAPDAATGIELLPTVDMDIDTLYAIWTIKEVTVVYNPTGGAGGGVVTLEAGTAYTDIPGGAPAKAGYSFTGWFADPFDATSSAHPVLDDGFYTMPDDDMTWFAQWQAAQIKLTLDAAGGSFPDLAGERDHIGTYGQAVDYEVPERPGYLFQGWNVEGATMRSIAYPSRDRTYSAEWEPLDQVTVTYDAQGGTVISGTIGFTGLSGASYPSTDVARIEREGYAFAGWYAKPHGAGDKRPDPDGSGNLIYPDASRTWYASWTADSLSVTLDPKGGTMGGATDAVTVTGAVDEAIPYQIPLRAGYAFVGWSADTTAPTGDIFPKFTTAHDGATYYAIWRADRSSALFYPLGGSFTQGSDGVLLGSVGATYTVPDDPRRIGYAFDGWFADPDLISLAGISAGDVRPFEAGVDAIAYWAGWTAHEYEVILDANGGSFADGGTKTVTGAYGDTIDYSVPERAGYAFLGWSTENSATAGEASISVPAADTTYFAVWAAQAITVVYDAMAGSVIGADAHQGVPGTNYAVPSAEREGYSFKGWATTPYSSVVDGPAAGEGAAIPTAAVIFFAQWEENIITVTLDLNGGRLGGSMSSIVKQGYAGRQVVYGVPAKVGSVFMGWREGGASDADAQMFINFPDRNTTYYAVWRDADLMYAHYYALGGVLAGDAVYHNSTAAFYHAPSAQAPAGYTFAGWTTEPLGNTIDHQPGDAKAFGPETQKLYYAAYLARSDISITLDPAGGVFEGSAAPKTIANLTFGGSIVSETPVREDHIFLGWNANKGASGGNSELAVPAHDETYYAIWKEAGIDERRQVVYNGNGGEVEGEAFFAGNVGESYLAPSVNPREGYGFKGWAKAPDSGEIDHQAADLRAYSEDAKQSYYACWEIKSDITVRFNVNGGTWDGQAADDEVYLNQVYGASIIASTPIRDGHLFMGWSTDDAAQVGNPNTIVPAEDCTYYAIWMDVSAPLQSTWAFYDATGGQMEGLSAIEGIASSTYSAPTAQRLGHAFAGWSREVGGSFDHGAGATATLPDQGPVSYYALWETRQDITITLDPFGGTLSGPRVLTGQTYGTVIVPETPVRQGYLFTGWKPVDNAGSASNGILVGNQDREYRATWMALPEGDQSSIVLYDGFGGAVSSDMPIEGRVGETYTAPGATKADAVFGGWSRTPNGVIDHGESDTVAFPTEAALTYYACWSPRADVMVKTTLNNGEPDIDYPGMVPGELFFPASPTYIDHVFLGWVERGIDDRQPSAAIIVPNSDAVFDAIWHKDTKPQDLRVVLYDAQGGMLAGGSPSVVVGAVGKAYALPSVQERIGYAFIGWESEGVMHQPGDIRTFDTVLQKTYFARWASKQVEVTLLAPGSDIESQGLSGIYGERAAYDTPSITGEIFMGWKLAGADSSTAQRDLIFPQGDATYEAVWQAAVDVQVVYDLAGGYGTDHVTTPIIREGRPGTPYSPPTGIYREGYRLAGWFEMPDGQGEAHPSPGPLDRSYFPSRDAIWYAAWEAIPIRVTLDANGGAMEGIEVKQVNGSIDSPIVYEMPVLAGSAFLGWATSPQAAYGSMTPTFESALDGRILYAIWRTGQVSVAFLANGGAADEVIVGKVGDSFRVPKDPMRIGFTFSGWFDAPENGNKAALKADDVRTFSEMANTGYWAYWRQNPVVVTLDGNGASLVDPIKRGVYGEAIDYPAPVREGHSFRGWSTDRSAAAGAVSLTFPLTDATYYAIWGADDITIAFDATGGTLSGPARVTGKYGDTYDAPSDPVRSGYRFKGWSTKVAGSVDQALGTFPSRNIVYYALWDSASAVVSPVNPSGGGVIHSPGSGVSSGGTRLSGSGSGSAGEGGQDTVDALKRRKTKDGALAAGYEMYVDMIGGSILVFDEGGADQVRTFFFVAAPGYMLSQVIIDGAAVEVDDAGYAFAGLSGEHAIDARFMLDIFAPVASFELAARYNPALWAVPAVFAVAIGGAIGIGVHRATRKRKRNEDARIE